MESVTPIGLSSSIGLESSVIIVPEEGLEAYKSAAVWKDYKIVKAGVNDLVEINLDGSQSLAVVLANEGIDLDLISQLKITGTVKASDFETLRQMNNLTQLDLGEATLENNELPQNALHKNNSVLESVILPASTKNIGNWAFEQCTHLRTINLSTLTNLETIQSGAFYCCSSLTGTLVFPPSLTGIEPQAFYYTGLTGIDVSQTKLSWINESAFYECALTGVIVFPETLSFIGDNSFNKANFSSITLKSQETNLYPNNFTQTDKSTCELHVPYGSLTYYQNANYWRDFSNIIEEEAVPGESLEITLTQMGSLENYLTIHEINVENVTELTISGPMDWRDIQQICTMKRVQRLNMLDVQMEDNYLPSYSFYNEGDGIIYLQFLKEVILPKDLQSIGDYAFAHHNRLEKVVLPSTLKKLYGFSYCSMLSDINIGDCTSLECIGGFARCTSLPSTLVLPNTVKEIGSFSGSSITYMDLSQTSISAIDWYAFSECQLTGDWDFPGTLSSIGSLSFNAAKFSSIKLRNLEMVQLSGKNAFPAVDLNTFKIYVPNNLVETYKKDTYWYQYRNNIVGFGNTISITLNNTDWGAVTGSGVYEKDDQISLQATCNTVAWANNYWNKDGSLFVGWFEGDQKLSENAIYRFTADEQDHTYKAIFERVIFSNNNDRIRVVNYDAKSVTATIDLSNLNSDTFFTGWYEEDVCLSKEQTLTIQVKDGSKERVISPRFEGKTNWLENMTISDANKVDGQDVTIYHNVTITGDVTWKPNSITLYMPNRSFVIESPIETSSINLTIDYTYDWQYIYLPYDLNVVDIQCSNENDKANSQFVVRYYDGEERAKNGTGNSWKQLKTTEKLEVGKGYIFRTNNGAMYKLNASAGMEALLTTRAVTIPLPKHTSVAAPDANWNLIGNPFPCYFKTKSLFEQGGLDGTITVWDSNIQNYQYYTQDDDAYIAPLTAFFVQHNQATSVVFHPEGRVAKVPDGTPRSASALRSGDGRQVINLVLANDSLSDKTRIVFNEEASADYELGLDAAKFRSMNPNAPAFYTIDKDNQQLAINERPTGNGVVRLGCNFGVAGSYRIAAQSELANDLILTDHVTGAQTNLKESAYSFTAAAGETNDRFEVRGGNPTGIETIAGLQWNVRGGQLFLQGLPDGARVTVHDTMGRTVCDRMATGDLSGIALPQAGVYYLTVTTRQGKFTERLMINE